MTRIDLRSHIDRMSGLQILQHVLLILFIKGKSPQQRRLECYEVFYFQNGQLYVIC